MTPHEAVSQIVKRVAENADVGVNLLELEDTAESMIKLLGVTSLNKGYHPKWAPRPFPSAICLGVNDVIAHPIPVNYVLKNGDLLHIDCGIKVDNQCGDVGMTIPIGEVNHRDERLLRYAKRALYAGIDKVKAGVSIFDIGDAIGVYADNMGYVTNHRLSGHGIGETMHEGVSIPHYMVPLYIQEKLDEQLLKEGQVICLEPHLTYKDTKGYVDSDGWTVKTLNGHRSAFFEHMIKVMRDGCEVLTTHIGR
jgi:methionyl aminopeptidase